MNEFGLYMAKNLSHLQRNKWKYTCDCTYGIVAGGMTVRVALNTELGARSNVQRAA